MQYEEQPWDLNPVKYNFKLDSISIFEKYNDKLHELVEDLETAICSGIEDPIVAREYDTYNIVAKSSYDPKYPHIVGYLFVLDKKSNIKGIFSIDILN